MPIIATGRAAAPPRASAPRVGVLAVQGSFHEHLASLRRCEGVVVVPVRRRADLDRLQGLILPGGESTMQSKALFDAGMVGPLIAMRVQGIPMWGTCAGAILLANKVVGDNEAEAAGVVGGLDVTVSRNYFGPQVSGSFEQELHVTKDVLGDGEDGANRAVFRAVFIRAPAILAVGESVDVLSRIADTAIAGSNTATTINTRMGTGTSVAVAAKTEAILVTAFHPELTADLRWHKLFVRMVLASQAGAYRLPMAAPALTDDVTAATATQNAAPALTEEMTATMTGTAAHTGTAAASAMDTDGEVQSRPTRVVGFSPGGSATAAQPPRAPTPDNTFNQY